MRPLPYTYMTHFKQLLPFPPPCPLSFVCLVPQTLAFAFMLSVCWDFLYLYVKSRTHK